MPRWSVPCLALAATLGLPATAVATTWTVDPSAPAGCSGANVCGTILDANAKVADGDVVEIKDGSYTEAGPVVVAKKNVTFKGTPGKVGITHNDGRADTAVFRLAEGTVLDGLALAVQRNGAQAVLATAPGAVVRNSTLLRVAENTTDAPVVGTIATGGRLTLQGAVVVQAPAATGDTRAPAVASNATSSIAITDSVVVTGAGTGPGVLLTGAATGVPHAIVRSQVIVGEAAANAVTLASAATQDVAQQLDIDSAVLAPGASGTGVAASNAATATDAAAAITVVGVHVTIAGGGSPASVEAGAFSLGNPLTGNGVADPVTVTLDRSIVHGSAKSTATTHSNLLGVSSEATVTVKNSDATDTPGSGLTLTANQTSADSALFADPAKRNYHLRVGSPAIDKGGPAVGSESDKDVDQQPRVGGAASDLGADEFVNLAPRAAITASSASIREGDTVSFDGSKSVDPDAGGGIAKYQWNFGDGTTAETTTPTASHVYAKAGSYTPALTVVDGQGNASSAVAAPAIAVREGTPPAVRITTPRNKATLKVFTVKRTTIKSGKRKGQKRTTRSRNRFYFRGSALDASGVAKVELSLQRVSLAKSAATTCVYLDGKTKFLSRNCKNPVYFAVRVDADGFWVYRTKSTLRFRPGTYRLSARATDKNGITSAPVTITVTLK